MALPVWDFATIMPHVPIPDEIGLITRWCKPIATKRVYDGDDGRAHYYDRQVSMTLHTKECRALGSLAPLPPVKAVLIKKSTRNVKAQIRRWHICVMLAYDRHFPEH